MKKKMQKKTLKVYSKLTYGGLKTNVSCSDLKHLPFNGIIFKAVSWYSEKCVI